MLFNMGEVLLLENLTYMDDIPPFKSILKAKGETIKEYLDEINWDEIDDEVEYSSFITGFDWKNMLLAIKNNKKLMACKILDTHLDEAYGAGGGVSALFLSEENNEAIVAFRGTADNEWVDDFVGGNTIDSLQQINCLEWYKKIYHEFSLDKYSVTVTGHSKGGNKAKYITILDDTPRRCVSFDGQGFSDKFMEFYKNRILKRQSVIENHNIDYDYVNILLNDVGKKYYYVGFDYGKGGFAEAHCPNTFFDFKENGEYSTQINPNGQRPEMQILDQFMNSMVRSAINEEERNQNNELVGTLVEKAMALGAGYMTTDEYINFMCDMIGSEKYQDNTAYLLAYVIKYAKQNQNFLKSIKDIMRHFKMDDVVKIVDMLDEVVNSKKLERLINLGNFLVLHVNSLVTKKLQAIAKKKYDINLTKEQIKSVLIVISMTKGMLKTLELDMDGSDISFDNDDIDSSIAVTENLNIVVLAGGLSNERNVSLVTGFKVTDALKAKGHNVIMLDAFMGYNEREEIIEDAFLNPDTYSLPVFEVSKDVPDLWAVKKRRIDQSNSFFGPNVLQICKQADIVFIALMGANGENGKVQAAFDVLGIDYTGCDHFSSALSSNKSVSKQVMINAGIPVPKGACIKSSDIDKDISEFGLTYPVIVKPCNGGIGLGISVASDRKAYYKALKEAFRWDKEIIIEEYVMGREFAVGIIEGRSLPVIEVNILKTKEKNVGLSLDGKKQTICPAQIDKALTKALKQTAEHAASVMGLNAYAKADFIVREDGSFVCLECDSLPALTPDSHLTIEAEAIGISYAELCEKLISISLNK